jgi:lipopolysaccharide/colanic/teichoic acid biosynthesis glycosyltransferase
MKLVERFDHRGQMVQARVHAGRTSALRPALGYPTPANWPSPARWPVHQHDLYLALKRAVDVAVALTALVLLLPVMLLIVAAIRLEGPGPIFYCCERVGRHARRFTFFKFRTMRPDRRRREASIDFGERRRSLKTDRDPRVTRVGQFLRKTSLDELPQLFNILRGDMSLVGPRPELTGMLRFYRPEHYRRHNATPGLTGWWQIHSRCQRGSGIDPREDLRQKFAEDLYYIEHRSPWLDVKILFMTIPVVLLHRGAV